MGWVIALSVVLAFLILRNFRWFSITMAVTILLVVLCLTAFTFYLVITGDMGLEGALGFVFCFWVGGFIMAVVSFKGTVKAYVSRRNLAEHADYDDGE